MPFEDFVEQPLSEKELTVLLARSEGGVKPFVNTKGTVYRKSNLKHEVLSDEAWIHLLAKDGRLMKRPLLVTDDALIFGFDKPAYDLLAKEGN